MTATSSSKVPLHMKRILVIDDSETIRAQVCQALRTAGYDVIEAADGLAGAFAIREQGSTLSLVICDVNMPRVDGLEMLVILQGQFPQLPILMLTTESRIDKIARARRAGAKGWIIKPFEPSLFLQAVAKLTNA